MVGLYFSALSSAVLCCGVALTVSQRSPFASPFSRSRCFPFPLSLSRCFSLSHSFPHGSSIHARFPARSFFPFSFPHSLSRHFLHASGGGSSSLFLLRQLQLRLTRFAPRAILQRRRWSRGRTCPRIDLDGRLWLDRLAMESELGMFVVRATDWIAGLWLGLWLVSSVVFAVATEHVEFSLGARVEGLDLSLDRG